MQADEDVVRVTVRDTGPGIPLDLRDRIFEPFFSARKEGTGLGLAIARRIARAHGGRLRLLDGSETGAAFEVEIPLAHGDASAED
jgi:signal transduction histidine kinase